MADPPSPASRPGQQGARRRGIVVVDDEEDVLAAIGWLLEHHLPAVPARYAHSGPEALALLMGEPAALLVADYRMPGMSGAELVRAARERDPGLQAMVITAYSDYKVAFPDSRIEGVPVLFKPFDVRDFLARVRAALGVAA